MRIQSCLAICLTISSFAAIGADAPAVEVGAAAPDLRLPDADGTSRSLAANESTTVLVFYRGLW